MYKVTYTIAGTRDIAFDIVVWYYERPSFVQIQADWEMHIRFLFDRSLWMYASNIDIDYV